MSEVQSGKFAVGEQVEVKGQKFAVYQLDADLGAVVLFDWNRYLLLKQAEKEKK